MVKACWMVVLPGRGRFPMVGGMMSREEALIAARTIWQDAEVE